MSCLASKFAVLVIMVRWSSSTSYLYNMPSTKRLGRAQRGTARYSSVGCCSREAEWLVD
jgi:hypothetical protein